MIRDKKMLDNYIKIYGPTMDIDQIARVLHISPKTYRNLLYSNQTPVPCYKVGSKYLADTTDVVEFLENQKSER